MAKKEFESFEEKNKIEKMGLFIATMHYVVGKETMEDVLKNIDKIFINEEKVKGFPERMNYFGDKIAQSVQLLMLKKIYEDRKYEDLILVINYIQNLLNKAKDEVLNNE